MNRKRKVYNGFPFFVKFTPFILRSIKLQINIMEGLTMPKTTYKFNSAVLDLLCEYASSDMTTDEFDEQLDCLAEYQRDVISGIDAYYAGLA